MNIKKIVPWVALLGGLLGACLRAVNLMTGYEPDTNLPIPGNAAQIGLTVLSVCLLVALFLLARSFRGDREILFEDAFGCSYTGFKLAAVLAGLCMIAAGAFAFYRLLPKLSHPVGGLAGYLPLIPLWLLAILSGCCFIGLASALGRRTITETTAAFTIVPMFWSCFDLIITFKDNGASPFVSLYAFELFAAITLTYAFYMLAGFLYSKGNPFRFALSAGASVFFCVTCVVGGVVAHFAGSVPLTADVLLRYICFLAAGLWLLVLLFVLAHNLSRVGGPAVQTAQTETEQET